MDLPERIQNSNKGTFGRVLNIAGSKYMTGAAYLSSVSALKIGCGYCVLISFEDVLKTVACKTNNLVFAPIKDLNKQLNLANVISIGCGLGNSYQAVNLFRRVIKSSDNKPVIIDADGLNILSKIKIKLPENLILTPHPKEASRLLNVDINPILQNPEFYAKEISKKYNCVTVLKLHNTVVCSKNFEIYTNSTGNSSLAKAGSGDVLTGMISGLVAQKMDLYSASKLAVYLHGLCGELASKDLTEYSVMADDLINYIPKALFCDIKE